MQRMTRPAGGQGAAMIDGKYLTGAEGGYAGPAAERLAALENLCEKLLGEQQELAAELKRLRSLDKTRTSRFRELMGNKLMNANTIGQLKLYGLIDDEI